MRMLVRRLAISKLLLITFVVDTLSLMPTPYSSNHSVTHVSLASPTSEVLVDLHIDIDLASAYSSLSNDKDLSFTSENSPLKVAPHPSMKYETGFLGQFQTLQTRMKAPNVTAGLMYGSSAYNLWGLTRQATGTFTSSPTSSKIPQLFSALPTTSIVSEISPSMFTGAASRKTRSHVIALLTFILTMAGILA